jgi:hypothetical protein
VIFRPLQYLLDLRPVGNIVKLNQTQRRAGNNQAIVVFVADFIKITVKGIQVLSWRIARLAGIDAQQAHINL